MNYVILYPHIHKLPINYPHKNNNFKVQQKIIFNSNYQKKISHRIIWTFASERAGLIGTE